MYNFIAAKMIEELEIACISFYTSYAVMMELDTKKKSKRKIWTREWLLKRNERGAYIGILKLVSTIFYQFLIFRQMIALQNLYKCFLFHWKSSFRSQDIQIFVIFSLHFHTFQIQKDKWKWNNLWCHELACINLQR